MYPASQDWTWFRRPGEEDAPPPPAGHTAEDIFTGSILVDDVRQAPRLLEPQCLQLRDEDTGLYKMDLVLDRCLGSKEDMCACVCMCS